jgi:hypothetical protein
LASQIWNPMKKIMSLADRFFLFFLYNNQILVKNLIFLMNLWFNNIFKLSFSNITFCWIDILIFYYLKKKKIFFLQKIGLFEKNSTVRKILILFCDIKQRSLISCDAFFKISITGYSTLNPTYKTCSGFFFGLQCVFEDYTFLGFVLVHFYSLLS